MLLIVILLHISGLRCLENSETLYDRLAVLMHEECFLTYISTYGTGVLVHIISTTVEQ